MVILVMGLPGSGKSYFAERLAAMLRAGYVSSDRLRRKLVSNRTYSEEEKEMVYDVMLEEMKEYISQEKDLVLDATFYKARIRKKFSREAVRADRMVYIEVVAEEPLVIQRLSRARMDSEADVDTYKKIQASWEPMLEKHLILHSTNDNIEAMLLQARKWLQISNHDQRPD